jgi:glutathione peroxidase
MGLYEISVAAAGGQNQSMGAYRGKVLLIVNTASRCGFTPQYQALEELYQKYGKRGLEIVAFPCNQFLGQEKGSDSEIQAFCQVNYGVSFPVLAKLEVKGEHAHPLFRFLTEQAPGWFVHKVEFHQILDRCPGAGERALRSGNQPE